MMMSSRWSTWTKCGVKLNECGQQALCKLVRVEKKKTYQETRHPVTILPSQPVAGHSLTFIITIIVIQTLGLRPLCGPGRNFAKIAATIGLHALLDMLLQWEFITKSGLNGFTVGLI